jgi:hypothetical protein
MECRHWLLVPCIFLALGVGRCTQQEHDTGHHQWTITVSVAVTAATATSAAAAVAPGVVAALLVQQRHLVQY